jgi:DNA-binding protein HU-beta
MKKVLLTVTSGALIALISSSALALNQSEAEDNFVTANGGTKTAAHDKFNAWEKLLKDELAAKREVKIAGLGTYAPKEKVGTTKTVVVDGVSTTKVTESYRLVKTPSTTNTDAFIDKYAAATGMTKDEAKAFNDQYINQVQATLRKGGTAQIAGLGTYKVNKQVAKYTVDDYGVVTKIPAKKVARFSGSKALGKQKFTADTVLSGAVN